MALKGTVVLNGTTSEERMVGDLRGVERIAEWARENGEMWEDCLKRFGDVIGETNAESMPAEGLGGGHNYPRHRFRDM